MITVKLNQNAEARLRSDAQAYARELRDKVWIRSREDYCASLIRMCSLTSYTA